MAAILSVFEGIFTETDWMEFEGMSADLTAAFNELRIKSGWNEGENYSLLISSGYETSIPNIVKETIAYKLLGSDTNYNDYVARGNIKSELLAAGRFTASLQKSLDDLHFPALISLGEQGFDLADLQARLASLRIALSNADVSNRIDAPRNAHVQLLTYSMAFYFFVLTGNMPTLSKNSGPVFMNFLRRIFEIIEIPDSAQYHAEHAVARLKKELLMTEQERREAMEFTNVISLEITRAP